MTLRPQDNPGYVDPAYLGVVARATEALKALTYDRMGARPGRRVLDVGCGPGTDTLPLAERVGPEGRVEGVDYDPAMVAEAERRAAGAGLAGRVRHRVGDAAALPFGDAEFDAVRCERLLQHLPDPGAALAEMVRVTRPGGRVVAVDTDFATLSFDAADVARERRVAGLMAGHVVLNGCSGRRLFGQMVRAGLEEVVAEAVPFTVTRFPVAFAALRLDKMEAAARRTGAVSEAELAGWRAEMEAADAAGTFFASVSLMVVSGTRPVLP